MSQFPSALSHVSLGTNRFEQAAEFYDAVLAPLGIRRILDLSEHQAIAYGREFPEFWIQRPHDGQNAAAANGVHIENNQQVDAFYQAALAHGAADDGAPDARPHYGDEYYGCFVRDLDGHKIEAMAWNAA
ncbi:MAG: VOC family protein [Neisseria sp.]|nr:VOC family protein [Neisseria sp.]